MIDQIKGLVLGGGSFNGSAHKALLRIGDKAMVDYIIDVLCHYPEVGKIVLVGPVKEFSSIYSEGSCSLLYASEGTNLFDSFLSGIKVLDADNGDFSWLLVCTADIPLITTEALEDFLKRCNSAEADFYYPVITKESAEERFPGVKRTFVRLQDGVFTGGNLFLIKRSVLDLCLPLAAKVTDLRKNPLALAKLIGVDFFFRYLLGGLQICDIEERAFKLLGCRGKAIITPYPEIGIDVDKESDLELVRQHLVAKQEII